jgi:hypothetical protein
MRPKTTKKFVAVYLELNNGWQSDETVVSTNLAVDILANLSTIDATYVLCN